MAEKRRTQAVAGEITAPSTPGPAEASEEAPATSAAPAAAEQGGKCREQRASCKEERRQYEVAVEAAALVPAARSQQPPQPTMSTSSVGDPVASHTAPSGSPPVAAPPLVPAQTANTSFYGMVLNSSDDDEDGIEEVEARLAEMEARLAEEALLAEMEARLAEMEARLAEREAHRLEMQRLEEQLRRAEQLSAAR